ncbi:MAG TPA: carboxypeptidase-like regulatory domain-containing protein [Tepidisphaeraceae bacterium]|jgi:5-hydroxyisourate hydrolase-like protein (transthyretin family)
MRLVLLSLVTLVMSAALRADEPPTGTGTIIGIVVTPDGKPAADCIVTIQQAAQKMREGATAATDADGKFKLENVPEGDYNLNARTRDLKGRVIHSVSVAAGKTTDMGKLTLRMK